MVCFLSRYSYCFNAAAFFFSSALLAAASSDIAAALPSQRRLGGSGSSARFSVAFAVNTFLCYALGCILLGCWFFLVAFHWYQYWRSVVLRNVST